MGLFPGKLVIWRFAQPLLFCERDLARFTVVGDGPERNRLEQLVKSLGIEKAVAFLRLAQPCGSSQQRLRLADVMCVSISSRLWRRLWFLRLLRLARFPWSRTLAGPGILFIRKSGVKVPLTNESDVVSQMERILGEFAKNGFISSSCNIGVENCSRMLKLGREGAGRPRIVHWAMGKARSPTFHHQKRCLSVLVPSGKDRFSGVRLNSGARFERSFRTCRARI